MLTVWWGLILHEFIPSFVFIACAVGPWKGACNTVLVTSLFEEASNYVDCVRDHTCYNGCITRAKYLVNGMMGTWKGAIKASSIAIITSVLEHVAAVRQPTAVTSTHCAWCIGQHMGLSKST